ncbi:hypothetical protein H0H87_008936 [Tephrocybe sp. NHM501043]|nr:hypothetical protein H0H87_008936 [Tephrocybe sp. NHM501043]
MPAPKSEGQLDPGPSPRKRNSGCKCLIFSFCTVLSLSIVTFLVIFVIGVIRNLLMPNMGLYHESRIESIQNRATVVQPLVRRENTFDLAATVWLRTSRDAPHLDGLYASRDGKTSEDADLNYTERSGQDLQEVPLFSDIIFRRVRMSDKDLHTTVNFTVPTALFQRANLTNYDLRGSVVLVPSSPTLLECMTNYSSYIPNSVDMLPVRSWPFPLGARYTQEKTLADKALESFAVSVPLIEFHGIQSRCAPETPTSTAHMNDDELLDEEGELEPVHVEADSESRGWTRHGSAPVSSLEKTDGKDPLKSHPYIVTRWKVSYTGRTPAKMTLTDMFEKGKWYSFNTTDDAIAFNQAGSEMTLSQIVNRLDFLIIQGITHEYSIMKWLWALVTTAITSLLLPLVQIKAVYRLDIIYSSALYPTLRRAEATHLERASERLEGQISKRQQFGLFLGTVALYYFFPLQKLVVIPARVSPLTPVNKLLPVFPTCVLYAMGVVGMLLQIILNWRSHLFGGKSRISAFLTLIFHFNKLVLFVPTLLGNFDTRGALHIQDLVEAGIALILAGQALMLPTPRNSEDDHHIE